MDITNIKSKSVTLKIKQSTVDIKDNPSKRSVSDITRKEVRAVILATGQVLGDELIFESNSCVLKDNLNTR